LANRHVEGTAMTETVHHRPTLVLGGTGKTGRRLVERLGRRQTLVRIGSRPGLADREQPSMQCPAKPAER
jgi:nucleoside-diphosphate-sugar epimerase